MRLKHRERGEIRIWAEGSTFARKMTLRFKDFISIRQTEGWPLLIAAIVAMIWRNSPWGIFYDDFWLSDISLEIGSLVFHENPHHLVNDLLLPIFFFILGLDLKHELVVGELSSWRHAAMPVCIGLGGMVMPVLLYLGLTFSGPFQSGWGVPIATDVAFTLAVLALLGKRIPPELKILAIAFAAVDDVGGVLAIAVFYTHQLSLGYCLLTLLLFGVIGLLRLLRIRAIVLYALVVLALLYAMYHSGVHTTIAGVILGLLVPARPLFKRQDFLSRLEKLTDEFGDFRRDIKQMEEKKKTEEEFVELEQLRNEEEAVLGQMESLVRATESGVERLLRSFNPWVNYIVLPLFALANAGISLDFSHLGATLVHPASQGVLLGLLFGKPVGIVGSAYLAWKLRLASLPSGIGWHHLIGMGLLAGMGFTVSLFIASLAFDGQEALHAAKTAVLCASVVAGIAGWIFLRCTCGEPSSQPNETEREE